MGSSVKLANIERDTSIQCRATLDTATINEYAERMTEGDKFPPVVLFGTNAKAWIGDGWHRVMATDQIGALDIDAEIRPGGRIDALKHAFGANKGHGLKRTNADKRYCVEIACREFPAVSSRQIAEMCGVDHKTVESVRGIGEIPQSTRTTSDGRQYPAKREKAPPAEARQPISVGVIEQDDAPAKRPEPKPMRPAFGLQYARIAIMQLEQIRPDDVEREEAFSTVRGWIDVQQNSAR